MTKWIIKTFIRDYENLGDNAVRNNYGKVSGVVGIICNILLFIFKLAIGILSGAVSITADALNNLSDAASSIISLVGFKLAMRPADKEHPYGHARYEYVAGLVVAFFVMLIGVELVKTSIGKIIHPIDINFSIYVIVVLVVSILVKLWMMFFFGNIGKKIDSSPLLATSVDSRNDVITTSVVLIALFIGHLSGIKLDGIMGVIVGGFILYSGIGLVKDTINPILGSTPSEEMVKHIEEKIMTYEGVLGIHDLMVHDYGAGNTFVVVHVEVPAEQDVLVSHEVIDKIESDFVKDDNINVVVHMDPVVTNDPRIAEVKAYITEYIKTLNEDMSIHDLRMVPGKDNTNVIFDCVVPFEYEWDQEELKKMIAGKVKEKFDSYTCVIQIEHGYI